MQLYCYCYCNAQSTTVLHYNIFIDVQFVNLTKIAHPEYHKVILQCSIIGLNADETDYDIKFYNLLKCEYYQQQQLGEINDGYSIISSSNGTTRTSELHILEPNASQSGSYSCKIKLHKDEPEECVLIETPPMIIDIEAPLMSTNAPTTTTTTNTNKLAIIIGSVLGGVIFALIIITTIIIIIVKTRKQPEQVQPQQPQPGPPPRPQSPPEHLEPQPNPPPPVNEPQPLPEPPEPRRPPGDGPEHEAQEPPPNSAPDDRDDERCQLLDHGITKICLYRAKLNL